MGPLMSGWISSDGPRLVAGDQRLQIAFAFGGDGVARLLAGQVIVSAIVENVAVLIDLTQRGAAMLGGAPQDVLQVLHIDVDRPRHKAGACCQGDAGWANGSFR